MAYETATAEFRAFMAEHARVTAATWADRAARDFVAMERAREAGRHISAVMYQKTGEIAARAARNARGME